MTERSTGSKILATASAGVIVACAGGMIYRVTSEVIAQSEQPQQQRQQDK